MSERLFIRFGEVPIDEKSKIYRSDAIIGEESGVSVWDCTIIDGEYRIVMPKEPNECTVTDIGSYTYQAHWFKADNIYICNGDVVGVGSDNEPLIKNVQIIDVLPINYFNREVK